MKKFLKNFLKYFNYEIISKNSWYKKQENYIAEIDKEELEILKKIQKFSMCSISNHWAILQSMKYISSNKVEGDLVEAGVFKGGNLMLLNYFNKKLNMSKKYMLMILLKACPMKIKIMILI